MSFWIWKKNPVFVIISFSRSFVSASPFARGCLTRGFFFIYFFILGLPFSSLSFPLIHYRSGRTLGLPPLVMSPSSSVTLLHQVSNLRRSISIYLPLSPPGRLHRRRLKPGHCDQCRCLRLPIVPSPPFPSLPLSGHGDILTLCTSIEGGSLRFDLPSKRRRRHIGGQKEPWKLQGGAGH